MIFKDDPALFPKLCGMILFSITSVIIGLLPLFVHARYKKKLKHSSGMYHKLNYKYLLSQLSSFGGGVLLSTTFLHLLPEIRYNIEKLKVKKLLHYNESLELPELLMCLGFLFLYVTEAIAHKFVSKGGKHSHILGPECSIQFVDNEFSERTSERSLQGKPEVENIGLQLGNNKNSREEVERQEKGIYELKSNGNVSNTITCNLNHNEAVPCHNSSTIHFNKSTSKHFLLIFALSIHEGFEGLAIGLEQQPDTVWYMIVGVGAHKAVIAFCIGVQMLSSKLDEKIAVIYVIVFSMATTVGVAFGLCLYMESGIAAIVLQGLATGTLLHVVFFELLKPHSEHTPFVGVVIGFTTMGLLKYFSP